MTHNHPAAGPSRPIRMRWLRLVGLLLVLVATAAIAGHQLSGASSPAASSPSSSPSSSLSVSPIALPAGTELPRSEHRPQLPDDGGGVAGGVTVLDDDVPSVANLSTDLLQALRRAATQAQSQGIDLVVNSGWRSPEHQDALLREAIAQYGSRKEAARWVATSKTSAHVSGDAVDIGPASAARWLSENGAALGLCQIYRNEPWHYELRPEAAQRGCPRMYADPTQDPRMNR